MNDQTSRGCGMMHKIGPAPKILSHMLKKVNHRIHIRKNYFVIYNLYHIVKLTIYIGLYNPRGRGERVSGYHNICIDGIDYLPPPHSKTTGQTPG